MRKNKMTMRRSGATEIDDSLNKAAREAVPSRAGVPSSASRRIRNRSCRPRFYRRRTRAFPSRRPTRIFFVGS